jgi:segregation and condensation protein B
MPSDDPALRDDEDPLEAGDNLELALAPAVEPEETPAEPEHASAEEPEQAAVEPEKDNND